MRPTPLPENPITSDYGPLDALVQNVVNILRKDFRSGNGVTTHKGIEHIIGPYEFFQTHWHLSCPNQPVSISVWIENTGAGFVELGEQSGRSLAEEPSLLAFCVKVTEPDPELAQKKLLLVTWFIKQSILTSGDLRGYLVGTMSSIDWEYAPKHVKTSSQRSCNAYLAWGSVRIFNYTTHASGAAHR